MRARLEWALADGAVRGAREFVGVAARQRPTGLCPCCGDAIVWKAGTVTVPHVAHRPDSTCAATNPETAAHLNAKAALARALAMIDSLSLLGRCSMGHGVIARWDVRPWSRVEPEFRLGTRRPDVSLLSADGQGLAAVEVFHTHAVDGAKADDLAASGLRWIEALSHIACAWDGVAPLPVRAADAATLAAFDAHCSECAARRRTESDEARLRDEASLEEAKRKAAIDHAHALRRRQRARDLPALFASPPTLHIAVAVAMNGNPGPAAVAAVVMRAGKVPHTRPIVESIGSGVAAWHAIEFALELLIGHLPGRAATIHTSHVAIADSANQCVGGDTELQRRVCALMADTRSLVVAVRASGPTAAEALYWIAAAKEAARKRTVLMALDAHPLPWEDY